MALPVNPASIAAARRHGTGEGRDGRLLVWEPENPGLYQSYGAYCRRGERTAIHVDWAKWPGATRSDSRRRVMVSRDIP